jgi:hypothetical protein
MALYFASSNSVVPNPVALTQSGEIIATTNSMAVVLSIDYGPNAPGNGVPVAIDRSELDASGAQTNPWLEIKTFAANGSGFQNSSDNQNGAGLTGFAENAAYVWRARWETE